MGMAKIDKALGDTSKLNAVVLEIEAKDRSFLPDGPRQSVVDKGNGVYQLRLGKKYGKKVKATESDIKDALLETVAYPISDSKIKALAKEAVGDAKTDEAKATNILKFVKNYIKPSLSATLPKMFDLIDRKAGDCKSYALMYTCLARAAGLPCREVSGFMYMTDDVKAFGGHAWNEVLLDGYWVPVDAGFDQMDADPTHIFMGTEKESINNVLKSFGKLNFKLIEVERAN
jgi:transglutaminase-like putative cysteine protease